MKILVINNMLEKKHLEQIKTAGEALGHEVFFLADELPCFLKVHI